MLARKLSPFKFKHGFHICFITSSSQFPSDPVRFFSFESRTCSKFVREGNFDEKTSQNHVIFHGFGVHMQGLDPNLPGYFMKSSDKRPYYKYEPDFDFGRTIGRKLVSTSGARSVVLLFVDAADFDVLFLRKVERLVLDTIDENSVDWKQWKSGNVPRVVLVVTLTDLAGARGNVWVVGTQNAGKSTLINSTAKHVSGGEVNELTEAPVPVTTLGILTVEGVLPGQAKLFGTPGLLHPHQLTTRLGGKSRNWLDVEETSVDTVYVTFLCIWEKQRMLRLCSNTVTDVSASGVGCFSVGLKGDACLGVWTYGGVDVTLRNSLIPQRLNHFEVSRIAVSKIVSQADRATNKQPHSKKAEERNCCGFITITR
ncbi:hypothetical protein MKW98_026083 [Papaver atlanticum]|uniref:G domain-containing protein n=1 Tax=Papaver atlanticum TaxID=357466 RepID=A0AAD4RY10_9MAGN|nr:hypothetical protein MKW98_026083 [Papaver atlanticum]